MRNSLTAVKAELFEILTGVDGISDVPGVRAVYPFEPVGGDLVPPAITLATGGMTANFFRIELRAYMSGLADARAAQEKLDDVVLAVEQKIHDSPNGSGYGRFGWDIGWAEDMNCFVAVCRFEVGREDGF